MDYHRQNGSARTRLFCSRFSARHIIGSYSVQRTTNGSRSKCISSPNRVVEPAAKDRNRRTPLHLTAPSHPCLLYLFVVPVIRVHGLRFGCIRHMEVLAGRGLPPLPKKQPRNLCACAVPAHLYAPFDYSINLLNILAISSLDRNFSARPVIAGLLFRLSSSPIERLPSSASHTRSVFELFYFSVALPPRLIILLKPSYSNRPFPPAFRYTFESFLYCSSFLSCSAVNCIVALSFCFDRHVSYVACFLPTFFPLLLEF